MNDHIPSGLGAVDRVDSGAGSDLGHATGAVQSDVVSVCEAGFTPNVARVFHCLNVHDELLAALEAAYTRFGDYRNEWPGRTTPDGQGLLIQMRDALALATGRTPQSVQDDYGTRVSRAAATGGKTA